MDLGAPLLDVAPGVRGLLLQVLAQLETPVTRRRLAALAGVAPGNASAVIEHLVRSGLVNESIAGRASLVELNRSHLAAEPLVALARLRGELIGRLRARLTSWHDVHAAWLFGSAARGDGTTDSDVDLLLILDDPDSADLHHRLARLDADVVQWTGNEPQFVEHTTASWDALVRSGNPIVDEIRRDGIGLTGDVESFLRTAT